MRAHPLVRLIRFVLARNLPWFAGVFSASLLYAAARPLFMVFLVECVGPYFVPRGDLEKMKHLSWRSDLNAILNALGVELAGISLPNALLFGFFLGLLIVLFDAARHLCVGRILWGSMRDMRQLLCEKLLCHPVGYFSNKRIGELLSRLTNDVESIRIAITFLTDDVLMHPFQVLVGLGFCLWLDWRLTVLILVIFPPLAFVLYALGRRIRKSATRGMERMADMTDTFQQLFSGIRVVKAFGSEEREKARFAAVNRQYFRQMLRIVQTRATSAAVVNFAAYAGIPVLAAVFYWLKQREWIRSDGSTLLAYAGIMGGQVAASLRALSREYNQLQYAIAGTRRIYELYDEPVRLEDEAGAVPLLDVRGEVALQDVDFSYGGHPVLKRVSLAAHPGQTVALVGHSGAGKSTLLDLIPRFHDPTGGRVLVDGQDLRKVRRKDLLRQIAVVAQETFLFNGTIEENVRYGKPDAAPAEVAEAVRIANLQEVIDRLPQGLNTHVGERGAKLSGGERQRVAIARAVLMNPRILLLDEATSDLDPPSERKVQEALDRLKKGRTTFVIAHRLSTVQDADMILVLEAGRIVERGTHRELLQADGGAYRRLYENQFRN